ncbi:TMEM175 family protein [Sphingomonas jaspsi]|uniref:TMEM175 family protein n=1 Tax=Sphingomonas jaspsi TaxID=392409 RepID=UPI0004B1A054|nr:TMEM175 family protein [Sphingomonas jaspsi]
MTPGRLNAFTDGVIAIIITIMVLELPIPKGHGLADLRPIAPLFGAYALSFINVGIFWNNHHHLMTLAKRIDGRVMWANLFLLFWLSLVPFVIRWLGEDAITAGPAAAYGVVLVGASISYALLEIAIHRADHANRALHSAIGAGVKEVASFALYAVGVALAFYHPMAAVACYVLVAALWFVPDPRVERVASDT